MSQSTAWIFSTATASAPNSVIAHSTAAGDTSATVTRAPSSARWPSRARPTLPTPATATWRPSSDVSPHSFSATAFMAHSTP